MMDLRFNRNKWVGNICQKFEAVCHEVDDIVCQDAKKYLENQVHNVGDSVKKFYSGVVHELLPLNSLVSSQYEDHLLVAETNNVDFSVDSVCKDDNKRRDEENPINHYYVALMNSNAIDIADHKQHGVPVENIGEWGSFSLELEGSCITKEEVGVDSSGTSEYKKENFHISFEEASIGIVDYNQDGVPVKNSLANQESDESCSVSLELEDSCITQEEVGLDSRRTSESERENFHTCFEEFAAESDPKPMNLMSVGEKESLEFPVHNESSCDTFGSGWEVSIKTKVNIDENAGKNSSLIADENAMNSSSSQVWSPLDEEIPINYVSLALRDTNAIYTADIQKVGVHTRNINQVSDESCTVSLEVEDSYVPREEVGDESVGTSVSTKENIHTCSEVVALESVPKPLNMISLGEKESLEFPIHREPCFGSFDSGSKVSIRTKDNRDVNPRQNSCLIVEENARNSSTSQMLSSQSLDEEESSNSNQNTHGILAEVSPDVSVSSERPMTRTEPSCSSSSLTLDHSELHGRYSFENESCKRNPGAASPCISDSFVLPICCESSTHPSGQVMEPRSGLVFSGFCQSMGSKDKSLVISLESCTEVIQLNDDDLKLEKSCVNVVDSELHAVACRTRKLRSYKKRIQDAFASKKRLSKEYEQLAIWYGDCDIEPRHDFSETLLPLSTRTDMESNNVQEEHDSESEWELL